MNFFKSKYYNIYILILFLVLLLTGLNTYKDYGIGIDDKWHRYNGFYWFNYILEFTNFENLKETVSYKLDNISGPTLQKVRDYPLYGVLFDVPAAILEILININDPKDYYEFRHLLNFFYFFVGVIYFFKLLNKRFDNLTSFLGACLYILSPRIYGDAFYNMKDVVFLTFLVISTYYCFQYFKNNNYKNLILFSIFTAATIQMRILGIFLPLVFIFFYFLSLLSNKNEIIHLKKYLIYLSLLFLFLVISWPYLWSNPILNLLNIFSSLKYAMINIFIFYKGEYINNKVMPFDYIPLWIFMTTPIIHLILFFLGFYFILVRIFKKLLAVENNTSNYDLWRGLNEKKDLFIFVNLIAILSLLILFNGWFNIRLFNGWKHLYFLNFFLVYIATFAIHLLINNHKFSKAKIIIKLFILLGLVFTISRMYLYHPYQGIYFNSIISDKFKNQFDVDFTALSGKHFLNKIIKLEGKNKKINIGVASWTPIERSFEILNSESRLNFHNVGQEYMAADYIYTNNISEVDKKINNKYDIPENFKKLYELNIDGLIIYEMYKKEIQ
tara:strand:- start:1140 stop:2804 length:1665 start_codon:yes stop_codon:yes gene_type:complete